MPAANESATKLVIDGLEVSIDALPIVDDDAVSTIFKTITAMDESEQPAFILSTTTSTYR